MDAQLYEELQDALLNIQVSHYMSMAGATVLLYDYLLALADGECNPYLVEKAKKNLTTPITEVG